MGFWKSSVIQKSWQVTRLRLVTWDFCITCDFQNSILTFPTHSIYTFKVIWATSFLKEHSYFNEIFLQFLLGLKSNMFSKFRCMYRNKVKNISHNCALHGGEGTIFLMKKRSFEKHHSAKFYRKFDLFFKNYV